MKISTRIRTATLSHPNDSSVTFTIKRIGRIAAIQLAAKLKDKDAVDTIRETLKLCLVGWNGLEDEDGKPIEFSDGRIDLLIDDPTLDVNVAGVGGANEPVGPIPLWQWLMDRAVKPETFDSDPPGRASEPQPTAA